MKKNWSPEKIARRAKRSHKHALNQLANKKISLDKLLFWMKNGYSGILSQEELLEITEELDLHRIEMDTDNRFFTSHGLLILDSNGDQTSIPKSIR